MKKNWVIAGCLIVTVVLASCSKVRRSPGRVYMPDMAYSRAYETYASTEALRKKGVHYNAMPVNGTIARGDTLSAYPNKNDSAGYANAANFKNPLPSLSALQFKEAARLYLIYCGICHGDKLDGNGPLWKNGDGPFPNAPKNFMADDMRKMTEGTMFHSVTYGKNNMGSYASQLSTEQRWMIIHYIKEKQTASAPATSVPATDSTKKGK
ncbi:MAG: c-type cytochrome [Chitinophagaceae bacterium]